MEPSRAHTERTTRFVIGIDLGTTNIAVSYVDLEGDAELCQFAIPQLIHTGEVGVLDLLPSFCYLPGAHELPEGALELPWREDLTHAVGAFAREQGAGVPGRLVSSAKSWLAHAGVDRTKGILPWGGDLGDAAVSPVQVSRYYLEHVKAAWDHTFGRQVDQNGTACVLAEQQVVLTVPASFDEAARELTLTAAREAGLGSVVLLEEPLAAFYAWLWQHEDSWQDELSEGETVLVVDVGGGTTDFSLVEIEPGYALRRTAVGEHLLLGGDNMDMAIARQVEAAWNTRLAPREWGMLWQKCRAAKELLLGEPAPETVEIGISGVGSSVVAGTRTHVLARQVVVQSILEGFFPDVDTAAPPPVKRAGIQEMGLPYAADPAVTAHLLQFLRQAATLSGGGKAFTAPDRILFNGGAMLPAKVRARVAQTVGSWCGQDGRVLELDSRDLSLAVSRGAAYYGLVRRGRGVRVKGGIARAYYLEFDSGAGTQLMCVMPRDTEEGVVMELRERSFRLTANEPVRFPLYCSATRLGDSVGALLTERGESTELPPLQTVVTHGKKGRRELDVCLSTMLNEVGTLDIWCTTLDGQHQYPLTFDLRSVPGEQVGEAQGVTVDRQRLDAASAMLSAAFAARDRLRKVSQELEDTLGVPRDEWGLALLRTMADLLLKAPELRKATPEHEARWLNLVGFLLRPGFGAAGDEWRIRELWKQWHSGPLAPRHAQVAAEWWVCWRRVAGGLRAGHQQQIGHALTRDLLPREGGRLGPQKRGVQEAMEMWRCLGALERLSAKTKAETLRRLLDAAKLEPHHYWVIARLGARRLFHGPDNDVVPAPKLEPLLPKLFASARKEKSKHSALFAVTSVCRMSGIRGLDVDEKQRAAALQLLKSFGAPREWREQLSEVTVSSRAYQAEVIGDTLPIGLSLADATND